MTTAALRKELLQYINQADERFLRMVYSLAQEYSKTGNQVLGYHLGKPLKKSGLLADLKEAEKQIEQGDFITIEELEIESKEW